MEVLEPVTEEVLDLASKFAAVELIGSPWVVESARQVFTKFGETTILIVELAEAQPSDLRNLSPTEVARSREEFTAHNQAGQQVRADYVEAAQTELVHPWSRLSEVRFSRAPSR
ncbi:hypothetical protein M1C57_11525 [Rhodococcus pyridinivorans]|uniref:hypothetical protein n=1 Tax=Rhodococcus pyridinivorans TaxID=103816 RepID=UPI00200B9B57|nr:hypothetical protein [Rhodococcus pyridinivorans]UPW06568.1 hypothetical protein M1C57_11525 [Rhodococcus pyridinivorans]